MSTLHRILADVTVVFHLAYAVFVVAALFVILLGAWLDWAWVRNFWFRVVHLAMIGIVAVEAAWGIPCPLTVLEKQWRDAAGQASYAGSFLGNLAHSVLFFDFPEWVFSTVYILFLLAVIAAFVLIPPRRRFGTR